MKKTLMALGAAAALTISAVAIPAPAQAQRGVAAGVAAGLIGGAIVGGAIASQNGYYGPGYYAPGYYGGGPAYVVDPGYGDPASGSASASGMAMAGASATSGFAIKLAKVPFIFIKSAIQHPGKARLFRDAAVSGPKKPFFPITVSRRLLSIDRCALF